MSRKIFPHAILMILGATQGKPRALPLSHAELESILNGLDLLASQVDAFGKNPKNSIRRLELKFRKAVSS